MPKSRFIVAINWSGIVFLDGKDKKLVEFPYLEVTGVHAMRYGSLLKNTTKK